MEQLRGLIGICSCRANGAKRQAVRETWFPTRHSEVEARFFVGDSSEEGLLEECGDVTTVDAPDDNEHVPAKVRAFFRHALHHFEFDWLFKCDDETYLAVERLVEMTCRDPGLVESGSLTEGGSASGAVGYLLSRRMVELLAEDPTREPTNEDLNLTGVAIAQGGSALATDRFCRSGDRFPRPDNDIVSIHGMNPESMRAVHTILTEEPEGRLDFGADGERLDFYENGVFARLPDRGFGHWTIDDEQNLHLAYCCGAPELVIPIGPIMGPDECENRKIGILIIATARYRGFVWPLIQSIRRNFLPGHERTIFLFTDVAYPEAPDLRVILTPHRPWPEITLHRYALFRDHEGAFVDSDYLFYLDADVRVDGPVGEEILSNLTAVRHPGYLGQDPRSLPYERNLLSGAGVAGDEGIDYYCGAVQGGARDVYLRASRAMAERIEDDWSRGLIAVWHDESHWNRYLIDHPPAKTLSPSYGYPEHSTLAVPRKIVALDKDHAGIRQEQGGGKLPETIISYLKGGLGNQMFQYANGLALARRCGASLELRCQDWGRRLELGRFGLAISPESPLAEACGFADDSGYRPGMEEEAFQAVMKAPESRVTVEGYFQNEKFFESVKDEIRNRFFVEPELPVECRGRTPVCLQVRRGDFIGNPKFDLCRPGYFQDAMAVIRSLMDSSLFVVVSDDLSWCRDFFAGISDVFVPDGQDEWQGMQAMAACKAFVISNSSYGWWGAWLSGVEIVVAPDPFLGDQPWECIPSRWIRMPALGVRRSRESETPLDLSTTNAGTM